VILIFSDGLGMMGVVGSFLGSLFFFLILVAAFLLWLSGHLPSWTIVPPLSVAAILIVAFIADWIVSAVTGWS